MHSVVQHNWRKMYLSKSTELDATLTCIAVSVDCDMQWWHKAAIYRHRLILIVKQAVGDFKWNTFICLAHVCNSSLCQCWHSWHWLLTPIVKHQMTHWVMSNNNSNVCQELIRCEMLIKQATKMLFFLLRFYM